MEDPYMAYVAKDIKTEIEEMKDLPVFTKLTSDLSKTFTSIPSKQVEVWADYWGDQEHGYPFLEVLDLTEAGLFGDWEWFKIGAQDKEKMKLLLNRKNIANAVEPAGMLIRTFYPPKMKEDKTYKSDIEIPLQYQGKYYKTVEEMIKDKAALKKEYKTWAKNRHLVETDESKTSLRLIHLKEKKETTI